MDKRALNRKLNHRLAEWAGVQPEKIFEHPGYYLSYPNFTESLDACFKWLVPRLYAYKLATSFIPDPGNPAARIPFVHYASVDNDEGVLSYRGFAEAETPALALCLAIEKLIDGGE